ncbi:unnamed protein product [Blepharisma stoltei]|uniref:Odorant receptor n=1 Tax=Blepharisma stoltei TaxID=1481888 RepID=A0AAU9K3C5_9CILI|nr:unnamed protein product [Blepharisma stoltei]
MSEIAVIASVSLLFIAGASLFSTLKTSKILRDIFLHQVFSIHPTQQLPNTQRITYRQLLSRYIPYYGVFKYSHIQYDLPPACHIFLLLCYIIFNWFTNVTCAYITNEYSIPVSIAIAIFLTIFSMTFTALTQTAFISSFNFRIKNEQNRRQDISEFPDLLLERSFTAEQRSLKNTLELLLERIVLCSAMVLGICTFWCMMIVQVNGSEIMKNAAIQFAVGIGLDAPLRVFICGIGKRAGIFKSYEGKYVPYCINILPKELPSYKKRPLKLVEEEISYEEADPSSPQKPKNEGIINPSLCSQSFDNESAFNSSSQIEEEESKVPEEIQEKSPELPKLFQKPQQNREFLKNYDDFLVNISQNNFIDEGLNDSCIESENTKRKLSDEETIATHNEFSEDELILYPENFPSTPKPSKQICFKSPSPKKNQSPDKRKNSISKILSLRLHSCSGKKKSQIIPETPKSPLMVEQPTAFFDSLLEIANNPYQEEEEIISCHKKNLQASGQVSEWGTAYSDEKGVTSTTINIDESCNEQQLSLGLGKEIIDSLPPISVKKKNILSLISSHHKKKQIKSEDFPRISKTPVGESENFDPDFGGSVSDEKRDCSPKPPRLRKIRNHKKTDRDLLRHAGELLVSDRNNEDALSQRKHKREFTDPGKPPRSSRAVSPAISENGKEILKENFIK